MGSNQRTDCFFNLSQEERIDFVKRRAGLRLENVFRHYFGWAMLPLATVATVVTVLFIITVYRAIRDRRVSRKCYILILNRAIGDFLSCFCALLVCAYVIFIPEVNRDLVIFVESIFIGSFWSAMVSYVALSVLKLMAVWKPLQYRRWFTMQRCIHMMMFSWFVFMLMISYTVGVTAMIKIPFLNEWSGCKVETCLRIMYRSRNAVTMSVYFLTLFIFTGTVILIRRAQRFTQSFKNKSSEKSNEGKVRMKMRFPLWKLGLNVATFAGLYIFYVIWCIGLFFTDQCFFQRNLAEMITILSLVRLSLMIRILVDPIISFFTDFQIRRGMLAVFGVHRKLATVGSGGFQKTASTSFNSSIKDEPTNTQKKSTQNVLERQSRSKTVPPGT